MGRAYTRRHASDADSPLRWRKALACLPFRKAPVPCSTRCIAASICEYACAFSPTSTVLRRAFTTHADFSCPGNPLRSSLQSVLHLLAKVQRTLPIEPLRLPGPPKLLALVRRVQRRQVYAAAMVCQAEIERSSIFFCNMERVISPRVTSARPRRPVFRVADVLRGRRGTRVLTNYTEGRI